MPRCDYVRALARVIYTACVDESYKLLKAWILVEALNTSGDAGIYHALEVQIDNMYHRRGGAVTVGVSAARQLERA